jgi:hypothetical protein
MADRMLFISWGTPVRGLEERGLDVFNEAIGLLGRMQQEGRIESFDVSPSMAARSRSTLSDGTTSSSATRPTRC